MQTSIRFDHQLLAVEGEHTVHGMLELIAPPSPKKGARQPLRLALVIDRSGSMAGPKLHHTKKAAEYLIKRLEATDQVALVAYDDQVTLVSSLGTHSHEELVSALYAIPHGGTTNLSGGWLKGIEEAGRAGDGTRKVLLLTDGLANAGITDHATLVAMAEKTRGDGVSTTTIGFGDGFDERLLTTMAASGGGNSYYVGSPEDAPGVFGQEFEDIASVVAQNVSVEIRPTDEVKLLGVLNEYPQTQVVGGVQVALGDAYGDENRRILFQLHIPEVAGLGVAKVADVILRYVSVGETIEAHEITIPVTVNMVTADESSKAGPDHEVIEEVLILKSAKAQQEARERAEGGDYDGAKKLLYDAASDIRGAVPDSGRADELAKEADILDEHVRMIEPESWNASSAKAMHYDSMRRHNSRRRPSKER